jgi:hypothetical protein
MYDTVSNPRNELPIGEVVCPQKLAVSASPLGGFCLEDGMKKIKLYGKDGKRKYALIDDEDYFIVSLFRWHINLGYAKTGIYINGKNRTLIMHRLIMSAKKEQKIDHINRNRLDNRKCNLRFCTYSQNYMNQDSHKNSSSKYKGVYWHKRDKRWRAVIGKNYKQITLGNFESEIEAAKAYNVKALELFGEFARLNIIN